MLSHLSRHTSIWKMHPISLPKLIPYSLSNENESLKSLFQSRYLSLAEAYNSCDIKKIQSWVEPSLYLKLQKDFTSFSLQGYKLKIDTQNLDIAYFNFFIYVGVHIDRGKNYPKSEYLSISKKDDMNEELKAHTEEEEKMLENVQIFVHPLAPANIVTSLYMRVNNKISLVKGTEEAAGSNHFLKFECEVLNAGSQNEAIISGQFSSILRDLEKNQRQPLREDWVLTDIDESLFGNPHVSKD